jgi:hypothetical protein
MSSVEEAVHKKDVARRLHAAIMEDDLGKVEFFLKNGVDVHGLYKGRTPLHTAAGGGGWLDHPLRKPYYSHIPVEITQLLIDFEADVNRSVEEGGDYGKTPLHFAAEYRPAGVVQVLIEAGAKVTAVDRWGETPLLCAYGLKRRDGVWDVDKLIRAGSDVNAAKMDGTTVLDIAVDHTQIGMVKLLLRSGAAPSLFVANRLGLTPLKRARAIQKRCSENHRAVLMDTGQLEDILERGDDPDDFYPSHALVNSSDICVMLQRVYDLWSRVTG